MKIGKLLGALAGIFTLSYIVLGLRIIQVTQSGTILIIWITGLFSITLWVLVIIDIDALLKKRFKQ